MPFPVIHAFFADDTCLIVHNSTLSALRHECNREKQKLHKRHCANELQINSEKSEVLIIPFKISAAKTDLIILLTMRVQNLHGNIKIPWY